MSTDGDVTPDPGAPGRLELLKLLGDNTRYAIYLELARSPRPCSTAEIAATLDLHANTVRPHLERMREAGLVDYETHSGGVGRPQHRYFLTDEAPALGLEPPAFPLLASLLLRTARAAGVGADEAVEVGRSQGRADAARSARTHGLETLVEESARLGFDPELVIEGSDASVAFAHCPFADLVAEDARLVCALHQGMVEGLLDEADDTDLVAFHPFADRPACRADVRCA